MNKYLTCAIMIIVFILCLLGISNGNAIDVVAINVSFMTVIMIGSLLSRKEKESDES